jgi:hypothetical protein
MRLKALAPHAVVAVLGAVFGLWQKKSLSTPASGPGRGAERGAADSAGKRSEPSGRPPRLQAALPPEFTSDPELDPKSPSYNPVKLVKTTQLHAIYLAEPRDETWSSTYERQVWPMIEADLKFMMPELAGMRLVCRTRICRAEWPAALTTPEQLRRAKTVLKAIYPAAYAWLGMKEFLVMFQDPGNLERVPPDPAAFLTSLRQKREASYRLFKANPAMASKLSDKPPGDWPSSPPRL